MDTATAKYSDELSTVTSTVMSSTKVDTVIVQQLMSV
jgi:hypothetical protein